MTWPWGHSHLATHCLVQNGFGSVQLGGQADPHSLNICPLTGHSRNGIKHNTLNSHFGVCMKYFSEYVELMEYSN